MNDSTTHLHHCNGCFTLTYFARVGRQATDCTYAVYNTFGQCPCTVCIVKCMCDKGCPDFDLFEKYIDDLKRGKGMVNG